MSHPPTGNADRALSTVIRAALIHHAQQASVAISSAGYSRNTSNMLAAAADAAQHIGDATRRLTVQRPSESPIGRALAPGRG